MNILPFLTALRTRSRVFLLVLASTVGATLIISLLLPKTYLAKTSLLVDGKSEQTLSGNRSVPERERVGYLQTQVDILTSPRVARRVVDDLRLADEPGVAAGFKKSGQSGQIEDWLAEQLLKSLKVDISQSSIIRLAYAADSPMRAARIANGFGRAYVDSVLDLRVEPLKKTSIWFDEQLKGLHESLQQAESRLAAFQRENGIISSDEHLDIETIQLTEMASRVARQRGESALAARQLISVRDALPDSGYSGIVPETRSIENLRASLALAESKQQELLNEFGDRHPRVIRQAAEVESLRDRLSSELKTVMASTERANQASRQQRQRQLAELESQRERVLNRRQARNQLAMLTNEFNVAQRTYDEAMQRSITSKIDSRALLSHVSVLNEALPPSSAERPNLPLNLALALVLGALAGLATVYFMELTDRRVRVIDDLEGDPRLPLLAVLNAQDPAKSLLLPNAVALQALPSPGTLQP